MKRKPKDRPNKMNRKGWVDELMGKLVVKHRTQRSRQLAGFKTIWR